jgi:hypothetical protein
MKNLRCQTPLLALVPRASLPLAGSCLLAALIALGAAAQSANPPANPPKDAAKQNKGAVMDGYNVHQSFFLGGHVANIEGSGSMYDTLVNIHSGPRFLDHTLELHPVTGSKHTLFDSLYEASSGYGGDPVASAPSDATQMPALTTCGNLPSGATAAFYGISYYDAPTQFGSAAFVYSPIKQLHSSFGYRELSVAGKTEFLNPQEVLGALESKYRTPYANLSVNLAPAWEFRADYNYYGYGEGGAAGSTAPRNFHANLFTLGLHYAY